MQSIRSMTFEALLLVCLPGAATAQTPGAARWLEEINRDIWLRFWKASHGMSILCISTCIRGTTSGSRSRGGSS